MLGVNASDADGQAAGKKTAGSAGRLQTEVDDFIRAAQLPTEALMEDSSMIGRSPNHVLSISRNYRCFANYCNKKVENFFSRFWNPNSSGVDVFVQNVGNENCLVVPPVTMITKAMHYLLGSEAFDGDVLAIRMNFT